MLGNVNIISETPVQVRADSRLNRNQVRSRISTFLGIKKAWYSFKRELLAQRLEQKKVDLVTGNYHTGRDGQLTARDESKLLRKTTAVAKIEEKILFLDKKNVPTHYVKNRAIKLKNKMKENFTFNCANAYSVGLANYDKVFAEESVQNQTPVANQPQVAPAPVAPPTVVAAPQAVTPIIPEAGMAAVGESGIHVENIAKDNGATFASEVNSALHVNPEVRNAIDAGMANVGTPVVPAAPATNTEVRDVIGGGLDAVPEKPPVTPEVAPEVRSAVDAGMANVGTPVAPAAPATNTEVRDVIDASLSEGPQPRIFGEGEKIVVPEFEETPAYQPEVQDVIEEGFTKVVPPKEEPIPAPKPEEPVIKEEEPVIKPEEPIIEPEEQPVNPINYDALQNSIEDALHQIKKNSGRSEYTPMTPEEIAKAQENIEYDKYEKLYAEQRKSVPEYTTNAKEDAPVREPIVITPDREEKQSDLHFDYSEATKSDVARAAKVEKTLPGLAAMKQRLSQIKEENLRSVADLEAARKEQIDVAKKAQEVKTAARARKHEFEESLKKFDDHIRSIEEQTKNNASSAAIARNDRDCNQRFIEDQEAEISAYVSQMAEINSIIAADEDTSAKGR